MNAPFNRARADVTINDPEGGRVVKLFATLNRALERVSGGSGSFHARLMNIAFHGAPPLRADKPSYDGEHSTPPNPSVRRGDGPYFSSSSSDSADSPLELRDAGLFGFPWFDLLSADAWYSGFFGFFESDR